VIENRPKKNKVAKEVLKRNPLICQRSNVEDVEAYFMLASKAGIILQGGGDRGNGWISMNDDFVTRF
jgi:hypothetical protein